MMVRNRDQGGREEMCRRLLVMEGMLGRVLSCD